MEKWGEREVTQGWRGEEREKMGDDRKGRIEGKRKRERRGKDKRQRRTADSKYTDH